MLHWLLTLEVREPKGWRGMVPMTRGRFRERFIAPGMSTYTCTQAEGHQSRLVGGLVLQQHDCTACWLKKKKKKSCESSVTHAGSNPGGDKTGQTGVNVLTSTARSSFCLFTR